jgi:putative ABC transport system permease protein
VVGVTDRGFQFPVRNDVYRAANLGGAQNEDVRSLFVVARLRRGVTIEEAQHRVGAVAAEQARQYPNTNRDIAFRVTPLREAYVGEIRPYLLLTLALAAVVLLIACANLMNLLLARGLARAREMAIRTALGARARYRCATAGGKRSVKPSRRRTRNCGGACGSAQLPGACARGSAAVDGRRYRREGLAFHPRCSVRVRRRRRGVSCNRGVTLRHLPDTSRRYTRCGRRAAAGPNSEGAHRRRDRARRGAADCIGTARPELRDPARAGRRLPPVADDHVPNGPALVPLQQARADVRLLPDCAREAGVYAGITAAAANHSFPLALNQNYGKPTIVLEGQSLDEQGRNLFVNVQIVSPNYFEVMGIPMLAGGSFSPDDRVGTRPVAVLSRPLANRLFGNGDAIGRRVRLPELLSSLDDKNAQWLTIVGLAEGVHSESLTSGPAMDIYLSNQQQFAGDTFFVLRTTERLDVVRRLAEDAIRYVDPEQPIFSVRRVEELVDETVWQRRIAGQLSLCFGAGALLLAAMGTYSLLSWSVTQRGRELAIRQALGSTPAQVRMLVVSEGMRVAGAGVLAGICAALPLAHASSGLLYGVSAWDPRTLAVAVAFTTAVALFASYIPAMTASRANPNDALKAD